MKLTYRTLPNDEDDNDVQENDVEVTQAGSSPRGDIRSRTQWDDDCPWSEWYSAEDPIKGDCITHNSFSFCFIIEICSAYMF